MTFSYAGTGAPSLSDITFSAKKGSTIGIIGGTGSGKSTLVDLIARFYDASSGTVTLDGQNVQTYSQNELRGKNRRGSSEGSTFFREPSART